MKPRQRRSALFIASLLAFGIAGAWGAGWAQAATGGSKLVIYGRAQFRVPAEWPVIDLASSPTACIRFDVSTVYLGRQDRQPDCPALLVGRTNAIYIEPLDAQSVEQARFPKASTAINGQTVYRGIGTETGGSLVAAFPRLGVLATVSFGADKALSERVLASFDHVRGTPMLSRTSLPKSIGIYIGGINRGCAQPNLTSSWVVTVEGQGWNLVPIYVGLQASCTGFTNRIKVSEAASEGVAAADDAATQAALIGLASGDPIYFDMESYDDSNTSCVQGVEDFISAWVGELHAKGFVAGMYGGAASGMRDEAAIYNNPDYNTLDDIWNAHWDGKHQVFGDSYFSDTVWPNHQRLHQYQGGHNETWGGVTINIDSDYDDGAVACSYVSAGLIAPSPTAGIPPGAVGTPGPRFDLFDLGPNGTMEHTTWTCPPGWSDAESIGGTLSSGPAATSMTPGTDQEAFAEGTDHTLQENVQDASGTWGGWTSVGGVLSARPAAVSWGPGRIDVFVRGTDAKVWHKWYSSGA